MVAARMPSLLNYWKKIYVDGEQWIYSLVTEPSVRLVKRSIDLIRAYRILDWQSEPHHQHQNYSERRIQDYKKRTSVILDRTGAPGNTWLLALLYVIFILNCIAYAGLDWRTPLEVWGGSTPDISIITQFCFWDLVYYSVDNDWPSQSGEKLAHFVGFGDTVGDALTYKLLTVDTKKIIYRSAVRPANLGDNKRFGKVQGTRPQEATCRRSINWGFWGESFTMEG